MIKKCEGASKLKVEKRNTVGTRKGKCEYLVQF